MLGPTWMLRTCLWAMTWPRNVARSTAYCSRLIRSSRVSFFTLPSRVTAESIVRKTVGHAQQRQRMRRRDLGHHAAFDLMARHRAIAGIKIGAARLHALYDRFGDLHGRVAKLPLDAVGSVVARASFNRFHGCPRDQLQHVAGLEADVLHPQVAGHMVRDLAQGAGEIGAQQSRFVP